MSRRNAIREKRSYIADSALRPPRKISPEVMQKLAESYDIPRNRVDDFCLRLENLIVSFSVPPASANCRRLLDRSLHKLYRHLHTFQEEVADISIDQDVSARLNIASEPLAEPVNMAWVERVLRTHGRQPPYILDPGAQADLSEPSDLSRLYRDHERPIRRLAARTNGGLILKGLIDEIALVLARYTKSKRRGRKKHEKSLHFVASLITVWHEFGKAVTVSPNSKLIKFCSEVFFLIGWDAAETSLESRVRAARALLKEMKAL